MGCSPDNIPPALPSALYCTQVACVGLTPPPEPGMRKEMYGNHSKTWHHLGHSDWLRWPHEPKLTQSEGSQRPVLTGQVSSVNRGNDTTAKIMGLGPSAGLHFRVSFAVGCDHITDLQPMGCEHRGRVPLACLPSEPSQRPSSYTLRVVETC